MKLLRVRRVATITPSHLFAWEGLTLLCKGCTMGPTIPEDLECHQFQCTLIPACALFLPWPCPRLGCIHLVGICPLEVDLDLLQCHLFMLEQEPMDLLRPRDRSKRNDRTLSRPKRPSPLLVHLQSPVLYPKDKHQLQPRWILSATLPAVQIGVFL